MSTTSILLLVVALIPLAGNLLALVLRRYGKNSAADWVVRMTPLAVVAASSKSREEAIARLTEEVMKLTGPESIPAQVVARDVLTKSVPPPPTAASLLPLVCVALALHSTGCTPQQLETAKTAASVAAKIGGAVCNMVGKSDKTARFACSIVDEGSSVIGNMSTAETQDFHRRTAAHFEVEVPLEQAEAFARENGGVK